MDYAALKLKNRQLNFEEARTGATRLKSRPLYFWFDIYGPCNLKCVHCGFNKVGRTSEGETAEAIYEEVMREVMPTAYTCNLGGTNWGEMTISKNFHRFLLDCKKYDVKISLTTNGTRMNDQWMNDLSDVLDVAGFSMEGMHDQFESIRGFPWKRFVGNIEKLVQTKKDRGAKFRIEWRYCAHADSIHQLPDMIRTAKAIGVERIQVMPLVPYMPIQKYKNLAYHRSLANQYFQQARDVARDLDFTINIPADYANGTFDAPPPLPKNGDKAIVPPVPALEMVNCFKPWQTCSINEIGDVKACGIYWRPLGSLAKSGFEEIWNGRKFRTLRKSINVKPDSICYGCRLPMFEAEDGRISSELRPSPKQLVIQVVKSWTSPKQVHFNDVMDPHLDPNAQPTSPSPR